MAAAAGRPTRNGQYIDALVALTIALVGVENVVVSLEKPAKIALAIGGFLLLMAVLSFAGMGVLPARAVVGHGSVQCGLSPDFRSVA